MTTLFRSFRHARFLRTLGGHAMIDESGSIEPRGRSRAADHSRLSRTETNVPINRERNRDSLRREQFRLMIPPVSIARSLSDRLPRGLKAWA